MSTQTRAFIEKLSQAKDQGIYAEECGRLIEDWYERSNLEKKISLADLAYVVGSNERVAASWNKHKECLADYFAEEVMLSKLTMTMHSLRQI